jgi:hypothetical protein
MYNLHLQWMPLIIFNINGTNRLERKMLLAPRMMMSSLVTQMNLHFPPLTIDDGGTYYVRITLPVTSCSVLEVSYTLNLNL